MTLEELLDCTGEQLEAMSNDELRVHIGELIRFEQALQSPDTEVKVEVEKKKKKKSAMDKLQELALLCDMNLNEVKNLK